jgi:hypothetical protein
MSGLDLIAVVVVTVLNNLLGMTWYSKSFLGTEWAAAHKFDLSTLKATPMHFIAAIANSFLTALVFSLLVNWFEINSAWQGMILGFMIWLGFIATTHFSGVIWAQKPLKAYLIDTGFQLVSMLMMGAILGYW